MAARPEHEEAGKAAWTHYKVLQRFRNATFLELAIFSGRTHQIRAHLLAMNHPIMGDPLYKRRKEDRSLSAPRLMLQSVHLGFIDPATDEKKEFNLESAPEFEKIQQELR
jgi:23S rRNA pseudouridine1911/1915/1917 synthase